MIYLDCNASTPMRPQVSEAVARALGLIGNPSSVHAPGRAARRAIDDARDAVASLVGASPSRVVFTSGGTEANNLALAATGRGRILASAVEHQSVLGAREDIARIRVDREGVVDLDALDRLLAAEAPPAVVSLMLANNETGAVQPVARAAEIVHAHGALLHCDAAQAVGRIAVDVRALGADLLTLSAHKMGGPKGAGALVLAHDMELAPLLCGGGQEGKRRAGTENVASIAGFGAAAALAAEFAAEAARLGALRDGMESRLLAAAPGAAILGAGTVRLPNTSCIAMAGMDADIQVMAFDLDGIAVSAGAACSSGKVGPSHVLAAMGTPASLVRSAIRVSLGWHNTAADGAAFIASWLKLHARARARAAA
ncbi:MAG: cysteine desulfurase family protein [Alphaproteobacteria bacterium]